MNKSFTLLTLALVILAGCITAPTVKRKPVPPRLSHNLMLPRDEALPFRKPRPQLTIAWDSSPDPTVIGYNVYYGGVSATYTNKQDVGNSVTNSLAGLTNSATYFFAVTAYDSAGLESVPSNEISYTVPPPPPPKTNWIYTITMQVSTNVQGVYTNTGLTLSLTNPPDPKLFFRCGIAYTNF